MNEMSATAALAENSIPLPVVFRLALIDLIKISLSNPFGKSAPGKSHKQTSEGRGERRACVQQAEVQLKLLRPVTVAGPSPGMCASSTPSGSTADTF